jgi:hypothetical protein
LSQSRNGIEHAGPASEEAVWRATVECKHHDWEESAYNGGTGRNVGFFSDWEAAQRPCGFVFQRPQSGGW